MSTIDEIKEAILVYMNGRSIKQPGQTFPASPIAYDVKRIFNNSFQVAEIQRAVYFLHEDGLLAKEKKDKVDCFRISSKGAQLFEESKYAKRTSPKTIYQQSGGVAIHGTGNQVGTINQVNMGSIQYVDELIEIVKSSSLPDDEKNNVIADAGTIKAQLSKKTPDKNILQTAWENIIAGLKKAKLLIPIIKPVITLLYPLIKAHVPSLPPLPF